MFWNRIESLNGNTLFAEVFLSFSSYIMIVIMMTVSNDCSLSEDFLIKNSKVGENESGISKLRGSYSKL